jgi:hypothetical protein
VTYFEVCEPIGWRGKDPVPVARFTDRADADRVVAALSEVAGRSATDRRDHDRPHVREVVLDDVEEWLGEHPFVAARDAMLRLQANPDPAIRKAIATMLDPYAVCGVAAHAAAPAGLNS